VFVAPDGNIAFTGTIIYSGGAYMAYLELDPIAGSI